MTDDDKQLRTIKGAARALSVSVGMIYKLGRSGKLELLKVGAVTRVPQASIDAYIAGAKRVSKSKD